MRRSLISIVVAVAAALVPLASLAGNQEVAEQVAKNLRASGQLHDYKVGVKYQDGTVWLKGQVVSDEQAKAALALAGQVPGVTKVKNELIVVPAAPVEPARQPMSQVAMPAGRLQGASGVFAPEQTSRMNPASVGGGYAGGGLDVASMRRLQEAQAAQQVATSFTQAPARQVMAMEGQYAEAPAAPTLRAARPMPVAYAQPTEAPRPIATVPTVAPGAVGGAPMAMNGAMMGNNCPMPAYAGQGAGVAAARYDQPNMPCHAWPSYAAYPNYAAVTYPRQYSPTAWPYIGPFYPYPQVPLGWRKVTLEWDDGWWQLDFKN
jgi:osmotically-inducible protein OsmY